MQYTENVPGKGGKQVKQQTHTRTIMKKYDSTQILRIVSEDGKSAKLYLGSSRRAYNVALGEWPAARKNNVLLRPNTVTACALCWSIRTRRGALHLSADYGKPFDITLPISTADLEKNMEIFRARAEWVELCTKKTRLTLDLPAGKYIVIDPCHLSGVTEGDTLGTAFDVRPLSCGGYSWRMFGDGPFVDSGSLCIIPAAALPADADKENIFGSYSAADRISFDCLRANGKRVLNINIRWGADKPAPSFSNIRPYAAPFISLF